VNDPLVSVCIGAYNRASLIRETLDSVLSQTYSHLEIIVVDDASTDGTADVVASYGSRVRLIRRDANSGMCPVTRNQALRAATGDYVAFLDSDDTWYPTKIERQVAFLERHPDIPLCHTYCHLIDGHSQVVGIRHEGRLLPTGDCFESLLHHCWITISSVMIRRDLPDRVGGGFTEDPHYGIWGEDHEFLLRVARKYPIGLVDDVLTKYRRANQNISSGNWRQIPESYLFHAMLLDRRDLWEDRVSRCLVLDALLGVCCANAEFWRGQGYPLRARWFCKEGLKRSPLNRSLWLSFFKSFFSQHVADVA